jgi:hypothetical protein
VIGRRALCRLSLAAAVVLVIAGAPAPRSLARFTDAVTSTASVGSDTLAPPTGLAATGGTSITLTWTPTVDAYATGYDIRRASVSGGPYGSIGSVTPRLAATTSDAPGAGTWYYALRSVYQGWTSVDSVQASATVASPVTTAYAACTTTAADTSGAGDNNGYQNNPARACTDDALDARDGSSGNGGTQSCGTGATPSTNKDRHRFWGFATGLPGSVSSIDGIRVRADLGMNNANGTTNVCAQLSWNGGTTWTTMQPIALNGTAEATYTFGGTADTWGRTWTAAQLSTTNFRVRLIDASSQSNKRFDLDYLAVSVTYTP